MFQHIGLSFFLLFLALVFFLSYGVSNKNLRNLYTAFPLLIATAVIIYLFYIVAYKV